jgi:CTP:molybdopterin cytidylyltransferase MocA
MGRSMGKPGHTPPAVAMVMAAGLGTRMRPYNGQVPKPLVTVGGKALIDHVLDRLAAAGIARAVVNVHHLADQIERHLAGRTAPQIVISDERAQLLGTAAPAVRSTPWRFWAAGRSTSSTPTPSGSTARCPTCTASPTPSTPRAWTRSC